MKIKAQKRDVVGKNVKRLRAEGLVPASVFGPKKPSANIQVDKKEFIKLFKNVGYSKFFDLEVGDDRPAKVLVKDIQKNPINDNLVSISFYQVDEESKITVEVPIEVVGESPAIKLNLGFLIQQADTIAVHCYPKDLPTKLEIDISVLANPGDAITVGDIKLPENVDLDSSMEPTAALIYIGTGQKEEVEETPAVEAEGEATAEGAAAPAPATEEKKE